ncbi:hypothetical protein ACIODS_11750 [Micromonospora chalcea]|uniref:hypothetical protein n=1 Tax=Micromonospora chalcea TaxID=1874 RepID=UPI003813044E
MIVREFEAWLADVLAAQPWVRQVSRWSVDGGPKPVGVTLNGSISMQLVGGDQKAPPLNPSDAGIPVAVAAPDASPAGWADSIAAAIEAAGLARASEVETYARWGGSTKPGGVRVVFGDGSEVFGSLLT